MGPWTGEALRIGRVSPVTTKIRSAVALVCAAFVLSSCGFDYATDRENTIANGGYDLDSSVKILAARIVSAEDGSGVLIGNLVNSAVTTDSVDPEDNVASEALTVDSISGEGLTTTFEPIAVAPGESVNLSNDPVPVTGEGVVAGRVVHLDYEFSDGTQTSVIAVVVRPCFEYSGIQVPGADTATCEDLEAELPAHGGEAEAGAEGH
ncbi:hypothetical protein BH09ACT11_BH09ACT11_17030 [soil metagenome]